MTPCTYGFRIVGATTEARRLIDWAAALGAYAACDQRADVDREAYLSAFTFGDDFRQRADEYLRLAYHGLRAKDKSFNAAMKTDFDETIGLVNVIPQDIGRVILNLITNAFYAVSEKAKSTSTGYEPTIIVRTQKLVPPIGGKGGQDIAISISDNGSGIPKSALDKIFQPFFTTKPTGQGTGLGLSLSYDIVKAHGGELKVETKEGEGSVFTIQLPIS